ncbi:38317_t:CDS:2 [Gigaspora margarita]|uniref:38317_t:CDS:1 n=1 Tax=Gigaspora margarita TaxID=4874 RepID=A0ABN7UEU3_GIGMA|nr:38317_t:CDS:2 [Gigaspora margarita]
MQTEIAPHITQAESNESAINEKNKEIETEPSDSSKDTKEEIIHKKKKETPIVASISLDIEMVVESADPLRDELADLGDKENLLLVVAETNTSVGDMQASILSQVTNIELDDFKVAWKRIGDTILANNSWPWAESEVKVKESLDFGN